MVAKVTVWFLVLVQIFLLAETNLSAQDFRNSEEELDQAIAQLSDAEVIELVIATMMAQEVPPTPAPPDIELINKKLREILEKLGKKENTQKRPLWNDGILPWLKELGIPSVPGAVKLITCFCSASDLQTLLNNLADKLSNDPKKLLEQLKKLVQKLKTVPAVNELQLLPELEIIEKELNKFPADFNDAVQAKKLKDGFIDFFKKLLEQIKNYKPGDLTTPVEPNQTTTPTQGQGTQGGIQIGLLEPPSACFSSEPLLASAEACP